MRTILRISLELKISLQILWAGMGEYAFLVSYLHHYIEHMNICVLGLEFFENKKYLNIKFYLKKIFKKKNLALVFMLG